MRFFKLALLVLFLATSCTTDEERKAQAQETVDAFMTAISSGNSSELYYHYRDFNMTYWTIPSYEMRGMEVLDGGKKVLANLMVPYMNHDGQGNMMVQLLLEKEEDRWVVTCSNGLNYYTMLSGGKLGTQLLGSRNIREGVSADGLVASEEEGMKNKMSSLKSQLFAFLLMDKRGSELSRSYLGMWEGSILVNNGTSYNLPEGLDFVHVNVYNKRDVLLKSEVITLANEIPAGGSFTIELPLLMKYMEFDKYGISIDISDSQLFHILWKNNRLFF